jgi:hypothetical protein
VRDRPWAQMRVDRMVRMLVLVLGRQMAPVLEGVRVGRKDLW